MHLSRPGFAGQVSEQAPAPLLFYFHGFLHLPNFPLVWISNFIPCGGENILSIILILFNGLRLVLWPSLGNVPCALERDVSSAAVGGSYRHPVQSSWFIDSPYLKLKKKKKQGGRWKVGKGSFIEYFVQVALGENGVSSW